MSVEEDIEEVAQDAKQTVEDVAERVEETVREGAGEAEEVAQEAREVVEDAAGDVEQSVKEGVQASEELRSEIEDMIGYDFFNLHRFYLSLAVACIALIVLILADVIFASVTQGVSFGSVLYYGSAFVVSFNLFYLADAVGEWIGQKLAS